MRHRIKHIHFIGIGGVGMSGLAQVMKQMNYRVSGSDAREQKSLARLREQGIDIAIGHAKKNIKDADCVVYSSAISVDNVERKAAAARDIPIIPRAQMLAELMRFKQGIAVAGTHGKTTVTSMINAILVEAQLSPTCVVGGRLMGSDSGAVLGSGDYVVVEADESDASFLHLHPVIGVVTNVDGDHLEAFDNDMGKLAESFINFLAALPFYGAAVLCADDMAVRLMSTDIHQSRVVTYGLAPDADHCALNYAADENGITFTWRHRGHDETLRVRALGLHNAQNALAACAVATELGVERAVVARALANYQGVERRLQHYGTMTINGRSLMLIDDYAHHPTEIKATLLALRDAYPTKTILLIFQPHRYSRTERLLSELALSILTEVDMLLLMPIYAAGEDKKRFGYDALDDELLDSIPSLIEARRCKNFADVEKHWGDVTGVFNIDIVVTMGAGDIGGLPRQLMAKYGEQTNA